MPDQSTVKKKNANMELLRLIAMVFVVTVHLLDKGHSLVDPIKEPSASAYIAWLLESFTIMSISLFILISGYFLVGRPFSVKRLAKLESQVLFYSILITLGFKILTDVNIDFETWLYSFLPVTSDFYWYVTMYFGMYLFSPVLNKLIFN